MVAVHGRRVLVETAGGGVHPALIASRRTQVVCGDRVRLASDGDSYRIDSVQPRRGQLWRHDARGKRLVATHMDCLVVVAAPAPPVSPAQIDRYLAIAALLDLSAVLVRNKADLPAAGMDRDLAEFSALGYPLVTASAKATDGVRGLAAALAGTSAALVGLSGVGKSSLIAALVPAAQVRTAALSQGSGEGRHTTTAARLYRLAGGASVIDSPGVRDVRLWPMPPSELIHGFIELAPLAADCRFRDCRHDGDAGCAVRAAAQAGTVSMRRYRSFIELAARLSA